MQTITFIFLSLIATLTIAQTPATKTPPPDTAAADKAYTPDPVSTTYRPLTGRLFFSDIERERLDKARRDGVQIVDGEVVARSPQLNGFVKHSDGRTTYWVDGGQRSVTPTSKKFDVASGMTGPEPSVMFKPSAPPMIRPATPTGRTTKPARTPPRKAVEPVTKQP